MVGIVRFEDIQGWQKARELVRQVYLATARGEFSKDFPLRDQMRRAALSTLANIAEGYARRSDRDFAHFLDVAQGSAAEVQALSYVAADLGYLDAQTQAEIYGLANETISLVVGFSKYLRKEHRARW